MDERPDWLKRGEKMIGPTLIDVEKSLASLSGADCHVTFLPNLALHHFANSLQTSMDTNWQGRHAVALCLMRHALESLTVVELGLIGTDKSYALLESWDSGAKTQGALRRELERETWPSYGSGLWEEPWAEYFSNLAKSVQPYAHCSPELLQWNLAIIAVASDDSGGRGLAAASGYDSIKASRLTLLHILAVWTLARILVANCEGQLSHVRRGDVHDLGVMLSESEFLMRCHGGDWSVQLWPHMFLEQ